MTIPIFEEKNLLVQKRILEETIPDACLFDFLGYEYEFGNEIGGPIMAPMIAR